MPELNPSTLGWEPKEYPESILWDDASDAQITTIRTPHDLLENL